MVYIEDERIRLAEYGERDYELAYQSWQEPAVIVAYNWRMIRTFSAYRTSSQGDSWGASIHDKARGETVGRIGISPGDCPDLTITIYSEHRGYGYGTAACRLAVRYAFETLKLDKLTAGCYEDNEASYRMLIRSGFRRYPEGDQTEPHILTGEDRLQYDFVIETENWRRENPAVSPLNPA